MLPFTQSSGGYWLVIKTRESKDRTVWAKRNKHVTAAPVRMEGRGGGENRGVNKKRELIRKEGVDLIKEVDSRAVATKRDIQPITVVKWIQGPMERSEDFSLFSAHFHFKVLYWEKSHSIQKKKTHICVLGKMKRCIFLADTRIHHSEAHWIIAIGTERTHCLCVWLCPKWNVAPALIPCTKTAF